MGRLIQNLQNKPEPTKKMIMWIGIFFIMTAIFTFWLLTFPSQIPKTKDDEATANLKKELPSVWQTLKTQINNLQNLWQK
ncbi:MAG: hypothetical protein NT078_01815 [Candidatus Azambacteria bacterium]|nr:hypothetical protein [Candidatus Azambacteria bacterium]